MSDAPKKNGRPFKEINQTEFEKLCGIQCTLKEIAGWFRVSEDTIERWCMRTYGEGFAEVFSKSRAQGLVSLRRHQFNSAFKGNSALLIWLGKQYLGQQESLKQDISIEKMQGSFTENEKISNVETKKLLEILIKEKTIQGN